MIKAYYIEPVGGHLGMHYYDFEICQEIEKKGIDVVLHTCDETQKFSQSLSFKVQFPFKNIYGHSSKISRGLRYSLGMIKIIGRAKKSKIHIAHFHFFHFPPLDFLALRFLRSLGIKIVITAHDVIPFDTRPSDLPWIKRLYKTADMIVVHTKNSHKSLTDTFGIPSQKAKIIPQGPYIKFSEQNKMTKKKARLLLHLPSNAFVVLFFGQIKKVKGLQHLILAFRQFLDKAPGSLLLIAGQEWKDSFNKYYDLIKDLGLQDRVIAHVKYIPDQEVGAYFTAADVVALPYIKVFQSAVLFMALSFAKPVIASKVGGLTEVIKNGETGILVPPEDEKALAQALIRVFQKPLWAKQMGKKGKEMVIEEYAWSSIAKKIISVYNSLVYQSSR